MKNAVGTWSAQQGAMLEAMGLGRWPTRELPSLPSAPETGEPLPAVLRVVEPEQLPVATLEAAAQDLPALDAVIRSCRACGLCEGRKQAVPGSGAAPADWMVVGEAPGEQEDAQGEPFVGASGDLLTAMLAAAGRRRDDGATSGQVYITNAVKCRPPGNRNPSAAELAACAPFLQQQLALVKPKLVLALGRFAALSLLGSEAPIGKLRTKLHSLPDGTPVVVSYHPSYLLRQPLEKARAWEDLTRAMAVPVRGTAF
jgi:uracil-DNA glycosylase